MGTTTLFTSLLCFLGIYSFCPSLVVRVRNACCAWFYPLDGGSCACTSATTCCGGIMLVYGYLECIKYPPISDEIKIIDPHFRHSYFRATMVVGDGMQLVLNFHPSG